MLMPVTFEMPCHSTASVALPNPAYMASVMP